MQLKKGTSANNIRYFWIQNWGSTLFWSLLSVKNIKNIINITISCTQFWDKWTKPCRYSQGAEKELNPVNTHRYFRVFRGFPKNHLISPKILSCSLPWCILEAFTMSSPVPIPKFWGFLGIFPQKSPLCGLSPSRPHNIGEIVKISGIPQKSPKSCGYHQVEEE